MNSQDNDSAMLAKLHRAEEINRDLLERLERANRTINTLEQAHLRIKEVRREHPDYTEVLNIIHVTGTPDGQIIVVE